MLVGLHRQADIGACEAALPKPIKPIDLALWVSSTHANVDDVVRNVGIRFAIARVSVLSVQLCNFMVSVPVSTHFTRNRFVTPRGIVPGMFGLVWYVCRWGRLWLQIHDRKVKLSEPPIVLPSADTSVSQCLRQTIRCNLALGDDAQQQDAPHLCAPVLDVRATILATSMGYPAESVDVPYWRLYVS